MSSHAMSKGEEKAWSILETLEPNDVCKKALVSFDERSGLYTVRSFGIDFIVDPRTKDISCAVPQGELLLTRLRDFFRLSLVWHLVNAQDIPAGDRLVRIEDMKDGLIFTTGSHTLPLGRLAAIYGRDTKAFLDRATAWSGIPLSHGDASVQLLPFPRVPVVLVLWAADEEFPARMNLLFDSSSAHQVPIDVIWMIAMMSILILM